MSRHLIMLVAAAIAGLSSCSGDDPATEHEEHQRTDEMATSVNCQDETRAERFEAGMSKRTEGKLKIVLDSSEPAPPAREDNAWVISVRDQEGDPMLGAELTLDPQMPDHGHGSPREAIVTELGDGQYQAEPISLFMPGFWQIEVAISVGELKESVQFGFCVQ